ncbi:uncharacterized protein LOC115453905 [Manduca sexta]|uniref:Uncharacterized protein n=1 Tax=Manduca sexta TaxID=7130 RepID=A0A921ZWT3_MANSE|nr:uncharacterized protein LOC115453905 [Manduca sexta]XP_030038492.1 uncharacterized protein LOC115453905 [Manduca sexta]KAG6465523.1 hypothetical protein O3G_MSEX015205 [Manduca sexta]
MRCSRLNLQQRSKQLTKQEKTITVDKPRRYCQKRMVNPEHEEDPRWTDVFERFHCNDDVRLSGVLDNKHPNQDSEDLYLTVQTLKFQGDVELIRRPRTSFKYKTLTDNDKHRMFVKQVVHEDEDADRSSQLTCYYFDDYVKYLFNNDRSRPTSGKSTLFLRELSNKFEENKAIQVESSNETNKKLRNAETKTKTFIKKIAKESNVDNKNIVDMKDAKIMYRKAGKRKSLTISRAQSPETVQVIRVDVVCNYHGGSVLSDYEESKRSSDTHFDKSAGKIDSINIKNSSFANKYLLTNTIKSLDENLSGGAKVTLLCKTFKLSDRSKLDKSKRDRKVITASEDSKEVIKNNTKKVKCKK